MPPSQLQNDAIILSSLKELEVPHPLQKPDPVPVLQKSQKQMLLLGFVVFAGIVSLYLFFTLGNGNRLTPEDRRRIETNATQKTDEQLFAN